MNIEKENCINEEIIKENVNENLEVTESIKQKDKRINELELMLLQVKNEQHDNILRSRAEIENIRRRSEQDIIKAHKFALDNFISDLLPVIDNLERTLNITNNSKIDFNLIIEGINLTLKLLLDTMIKFGLNTINDVDVTFNPEIHQAMKIIDSEEYKPNKVVTIMQKGYTLNGRLIRPAMVTVSKNKENTINN